jgi:hypothetical protein
VFGCASRPPGAITAQAVPFCVEWSITISSATFFPEHEPPHTPPCHLILKTNLRPLNTSCRIVSPTRLASWLLVSLVGHRVWWVLASACGLEHWKLITRLPHSCLQVPCPHHLGPSSHQPHPRLRHHCRLCPPTLRRRPRAPYVSPSGAYSACHDPYVWFTQRWFTSSAPAAPQLHYCLPSTSTLPGRHLVQVFLRACVSFPSPDAEHT